MKFCCKTETLTLQINTNLTVSVPQLIINDKTTKKEAFSTLQCMHNLQHQLRHLEALYFLGLL